MTSELIAGSDERAEQVERVEELLSLLDQARDIFSRMEYRDPSGMGHARAYGMEQHLYDSDRRWTANSLYSEMAQYRDELKGDICEFCGESDCGCGDPDEDAAYEECVRKGYVTPSR